MRLSQVIAKLDAEGFVATPGRIRQAVNNGFVQPLPEKAARGAYDYQPEHLRLLRWYFVNVRPGPRPYQCEELPVKAAEDRMHLLAQKKQLLQEKARERTRRQLARLKTDAAIAEMEQIVQELAR